MRFIILYILALETISFLSKLKIIDYFLLFQFYCLGNIFKTVNSTFFQNDRSILKNIHIVTILDRNEDICVHAKTKQHK